jgi:dihydroneopterin aldolase
VAAWPRSMQSVISVKKDSIDMITIHLNKLTFFSHHGVHNEETIVGTGFEINVAISFEETQKIVSLDQTINYVTVYHIIKDHMKKPSLLLETVAMQVAEDIHKIDRRIRTINISISKLNPPINNFTGNVGVTYIKEFAL